MTPMLKPSQYRVRSPLFPDYTTVRRLLRIWDGVPQDKVREMIATIHEQTGTPQKPVDWSEPDTWIPERLQGAIADLAMRTWKESKQHVNPRHCYGGYLLIHMYELLQTDGAGVYRLSDNGKAFLNGDPAIIRELDEQEGIFHLLTLLAAKPSAKRGDLLGDWGDYLHKYSKFGKTSTTIDTLRRRLLNLVERDLVAREGNSYSITDAGNEYIGAAKPQGENPKQGHHRHGAGVQHRTTRPTERNPAQHAARKV